MTGETLARRLLRLDAAYCALAGLIAVVASAPLADLLAAPDALILVVGVATVAWAVFLRRLARRVAWRAPVTVVAAVNLVAAAGIAAVAFATPRLLGQVLLAAVAIEVAAFAAGQTAALRR